MESLLSIELAEETAALASKIASEANPLKAMFSGVDEAGIRDQAKLVASLAAKLVHGGALIAKLLEVKDDTVEISLLFQQNKDLITALIGVVDSIMKSSDSVRSNYDAEEFVTQQIPTGHVFFFSILDNYISHLRTQLLPLILTLKLELKPLTKM